MDSLSKQNLAPPNQPGTLSHPMSTYNFTVGTQSLSEAPSRHGDTCKQRRRNYPLQCTRELNFQTTPKISKTKPKQGCFEPSFIVLRGRPFILSVHKTPPEQGVAFRWVCFMRCQFNGMRFTWGRMVLIDRPMPGYSNNETRIDFSVNILNYPQIPK
jgi:hypothetical protein